MKRILIDGMTNNLGGIEKFSHLIFETLKDDWEIDFITVDPEIPYQKEFIKSGCRIHVITPRYKNLVKYKREIKEVFKKGAYDVFWFNKTTLSSIDCVKAARKYGVNKIICHAHTSKNMGSSFTAIMHNVHRGYINKNIKYKVACSNSAAEYFYKEQSKNCRIFTNGVDLELYKPNEEKRNEMRNKLNINDKFVIGHIGRFSNEKNHRFIIRVFEEINKEYDNCTLVLCGDGELLDQIKEEVRCKQLSDKVLFLGIRNDIPDILQAIDVFLFPSLFEGLPFALVEAQAAGIPCIVSDTVSSESKLTDLVHFVSLESNVNKWKEKIMEFRYYRKVSRSKELENRGYSIKAIERNIRHLVE